MISWLPPSLPAWGPDRCPQAKTGCSTIDYRVSFGKEVLLGQALGDIFLLQTFGTPSLLSSYVIDRLPTSLSSPGSKRCPQAVECSLMLWILGFPSHSQLQAQAQGVPGISLYHGSSCLLLRTRLVKYVGDTVVNVILIVLLLSCASYVSSHFKPNYP